MECFRKILFNNGTTYAGRSSPILQTLLNFFGRKRHSVSSEIVYPIKDSRPWKSGTYPLRLNKGVPSEYLHFLVFCLIQNRQNPTSYFIHFVFSQFLSYLVVLSNFLTVLVFLWDEKSAWFSGQFALFEWAKEAWIRAQILLTSLSCDVSSEIAEDDWERGAKNLLIVNGWKNLPPIFLTSRNKRAIMQSGSSMQSGTWTNLTNFLMVFSL